MKTRFFTFVCTICVIWMGVAVAYTQDNSASVAEADSWNRIVSNDGRFSVEIPAKHRMYFNANGFQVSIDYSSYNLTNLYFISSFVDNTLINLEVYEGGKYAYESILRSDKQIWGTRTEPDFEFGKVKLKRFIKKTEDYFAVTELFNSHGQIYILTAASRNGETSVMKRFLASVKYNSENLVTQSSDMTRISDLKSTEIQIEIKLEDEEIGKPPKQMFDQPTDDTSIQKLIILRKPRAHFAQSARIKNTSGAIRLRVTLAEDGFVQKIVVSKTLPDGLLRQAVFAAARIRFLPKQEKGVFVPSVAVVDYSFIIY